MLADGARQLSVNLTDQHSTSLVQFLQILNKWNRVHNLTAVRNIEEMVGRHILDSLSVVRWLAPINNATSSSSNADTVVDVLDVGTGAGLPVLPLAILRPDLRFLSVESNGKKTSFQRQAILELGLRNVRVAQERIEDNHEQASTLISRAFTAPEKFIQSVAKNCLVDSQVIIMLGSKDKLPTELPGGFVLSELNRVEVPQCDSTRHVAICKRSST